MLVRNSYVDWVKERGREVLKIRPIGLVCVLDERPLIAISLYNLLVYVCPA